MLGNVATHAFERVRIAGGEFGIAPLLPLQFGLELGEPISEGWEGVFQSLGGFVDDAAIL